MFRIAQLASIALICLASLSCQSFSEGVKEGAKRGNEVGATGTLRSIATVQQTYAVSNGGNYGTFEQLAAGSYLDSRFNSDKPVVNQYMFTMEVGSAAEGPYFRCHADPTGETVQGARHFYIDSSSSAFHVNPTQPASSSDPIVQP